MTTSIKKITRRHGSIYNLPQNIRDDIDMLLVEDKNIYQDIVDFIKTKHGINISDSALSRYYKNFIEESRLRKTLMEHAARLGDDPENAYAMEKLTSSMITRRLADAMMDNTLDIVQDAKLIMAFASLQKANIQREQWQAEVKKKVEKTANDITKVIKKNGISDSTALQIREKILGINK